MLKPRSLNPESLNCFTDIFSKYLSTLFIQFLQTCNTQLLTLLSFRNPKVLLLCQPSTPVKEPLLYIVVGTLIHIPVVFGRGYCSLTFSQPFPLSSLNFLANPECWVFYYYDFSLFMSLYLLPNLFSINICLCIFLLLQTVQQLQLAQSE